MSFSKFRMMAFFVAVAFSSGNIFGERTDETNKTSVTYDLTAETAVGSGRYTAYQLVTNRHHVLATRANTAYVRGTVNVSHKLSERFTLSGSVDAIASVHADHSLFLQQCYARLDGKYLFVEAGSHESGQVVRNDSLSVGSFVKGTNAKPVPQARIGTRGFQYVPFTKQWVQVNAEGGYGKFLDSDHRQDMMIRSGGDTYTTGAYYHQAHLYIRSNPTKRVFAMIGIEHVAQFGGTRYTFVGDEKTGITKPANLKAFLNVILPLGDKSYFENSALEDWVYGNHVGVMTYQVGVNITSHHRLQAYLDNPFEDGSGIRKGNGYDGLWGLEYTCSKPGRQYVRAAVVEYFQSTCQSGPLHWDGGDYPEPIRSQITDLVVGNDNYYNNTFYDSYSYYSMTPGIALITSPIYNEGGGSIYLNNRVKAWHLGVKGELTDKLSYMLKGSYSEGWGTYSAPAVRKKHSFDVMLLGSYALGALNVSAAYALSRGNIYGNCSTCNLKISYHGKIF